MFQWGFGLVSRIQENTELSDQYCLDSKSGAETEVLNVFLFHMTYNEAMPDNVTRDAWHDMIVYENAEEDSHD